jgi:hypothetical protein
MKVKAEKQSTREAEHSTVQHRKEYVDEEWREEDI